MNCDRKQTSKVAPGICVMLALLLSSSSCGDKEDKPNSQANPSVQAAPKVSRVDKLAGAAEYVLEQILALESERDVTCWTSFRQLDWYIAEKQYGEFATLAKVVAVKALVRSIWQRASEDNPRGPLTIKDIRGVVHLPIFAVTQAGSAPLEEFANDIGIKNYSDYQSTAEHWRVVLAVLEDEIAETGSESGLVALQPKAIDALAQAATSLSLMLLKESGTVAEIAKSQTIEAAHLSAAFTAIADETGLVIAPRKRKKASAKVLATYLVPLTHRLITGKFQALLAYNKGAENVVDKLNQVASMPLSKSAVALLERDLKSFVRFVTLGRSPMRMDNYLSDGSYVSSSVAAPGFLSAMQVQNVVMQIFPHRILANGDILVRFEPNPGPMMDKGLEPFEIRILDHEMNGVRDSAIHWSVADQVWKDSPFALDPFAAEYLSEVVSMMMATWIHRSEQIATSMGKTTIDEEVAKRVRSMAYVMVPPVDRTAAASWGAEEEAEKQTLMKAYKAPLFEEVGAQSGLPTELAAFDDQGQRRSVEGARTTTAFDLQTIMGAGIAVGDVNADGYEDFYISGEELGDLYVNKGAAAPGQFEKVTAAYGLPTDLHDGHGTLFFDLEGDGDLDLLVLRSKHPSALFVQDKGRFVDAAKALKFTTHYGAHVAHVFDYDRDGDLDIFVGYYGSKEAHEKFGKIRSKPALDGLNGSANQLWRNDGKTLTEVGREAGLDDVGWALAASSFDYDADGYADLYVANDFGANSMFHNLGNGRFEAVAAQLHVDDRGSGMNVDVSDINQDGKWDFYVSNIDMFSKNIKVVFPRDESTIDIGETLSKSFQYLSGNQLYVSTKEGGFAPEAVGRFEPQNRGWGWDAVFFDVENDGDDDLYLSNGWIQGSYAGSQKNQLYLQQAGRFFMAAQDRAEAFAGNTRSTAAFDIDNDGDLDLLTNNFRQAPKLLRNVQSKKNRWIKIALKGKGRNPYAVGARVQIKTPEGSILRQVSGGRGYLSQASTIISAGLGTNTKVDIVVMWPDGSTSEHQGLRANQIHTIAQ